MAISHEYEKKKDVPDCKLYARARSSTITGIRALQPRLSSLQTTNETPAMRVVENKHYLLHHTVSHGRDAICIEWLMFLYLFIRSRQLYLHRLFKVTVCIRNLYLSYVNNRSGSSDIPHTRLQCHRVHPQHRTVRSLTPWHFPGIGVVVEAIHNDSPIHAWSRIPVSYYNYNQNTNKNSQEAQQHTLVREETADHELKLCNDHSHARTLLGHCFPHCKLELGVCSRTVFCSRKAISSTCL